MEKRRHERRQPLKSGKIIFSEEDSAVDCLVRNFSDGGACLLVPSVVGIPSEFELVTAGVSKDCRVAWKTGNQIGVSFRKI